MPDAEPISVWLRELQAGNAAAAGPLWDQYFDRLVHLARRKLPAHARRSADEEDVALSAFKSLCLGLRRGRFPRLDDRDDLWGLLVVITARKTVALTRRETRRKRGGGKVQGESGLVFPGADAAGLEQVVGAEPTPAFAAQVAEECDRLLAALDDDCLRQIALLRMEGHTREEIAAKLGRSLRSIARRLDLIRRTWTALGAGEAPAD